MWSEPKFRWTTRKNRCTDCRWQLRITGIRPNRRFACSGSRCWTWTTTGPRSPAPVSCFRYEFVFVPCTFFFFPLYNLTVVTYSYFGGLQRPDRIDLSSMVLGLTHEFSNKHFLEKLSGAQNRRLPASLNSRPVTYPLKLGAVQRTDGRPNEYYVSDWTLFYQSTQSRAEFSI